MALLVFRYVNFNMILNYIGDLFESEKTILTQGKIFLHTADVIIYSNYVTGKYFCKFQT